jgi:hypothetical protein
MLLIVLRLHLVGSPNSRYDDTSGWDQNKSNQFQLEMEKCFDKVAEMYISSLIL